MSKSRAKKKQRRRARPVSGPPVTAREPEPELPATAPPRPARIPERFEVRDGIPRPEAVWAPFPLTELGIFVGIVVFMLGYFASADRSPALLGTGAIILAVVVGEMCLREHFAGFRSHSILLALLPVTVVHTFVVYAITPGWHGPVALVIDLVIAVALAWWLQRRYREAHAKAKMNRLLKKPKPSG